MPLATVNDYLTEVRTLLQDKTVPYRFSDNDLKDALGFSLMEARRLRADLFPNGVIPSIDRNSLGTVTVAMDDMYRMALVYYVVGHMYLREEEEGSQALGDAYKRKFGAQMVSIAV